MDFATILGKYIRHLRKQSVHNQRVHAFSISGLLTIILTVLWLHFHYGFWSSADEAIYSQDQSYEVRELTINSATAQTKIESTSSPSEVLKDFLDEIKRRVDGISFDFSGVIGNTETFERKE